MISIDQITIDNVYDIIDSLPPIDIDTCSDAEFECHMKMEDELWGVAMANLDAEMEIDQNADKWSSRRP